MAATQGKIRLPGAQLVLNMLGGAVSFSSASTAPAYAPGLVWINAGQLYLWSGTAWVSAAGRYLCLLTTDPDTSGPGGGPATAISDLVEVTTAGYARAPVSVGLAGPSMPCVATSTGMVSWGPFTADMAAPAKWAALVTAPSGPDGILLYTWSGISEQVSASQSVEVPAGGLILNTGS